jgi:diguanylate cyclase (GGDEF)-like protein
MVRPEDQRDPEDSGVFSMYGRTVDEDTRDMAVEGIEACPYLVVLHGEDRGKSFALDKGRVTIGRSRRADVVLHDKRVSRLHCTLVVDGENVRVEDNESHNGVLVDNQRVEEGVLKPHTQLRVGRTIMRVEYKADAQVEMEEALFRAATTDPLTGLFNRRYFVEQAQSEISLAGRRRRDLCAIMIDVDHFKQVNDTHGHQAGDFVLSSLAGLLQAVKRHEDLLCRWGGEEFLFMLREVPLPDAVTFGDRVRTAVEKHPFVCKGRIIELTISVGVSVLHHTETLDDLVNRADRALYVAKQNGRNRVETEESTL